MSKRTKDYILGLYVGEYIVANDLPTLSTDMIKTNRVIEVSEEDTKHHEMLVSKWINAHKDSNGVNEHWQPHFDFMKELERKYLPHEIYCRVPKCVSVIDNMKEFKEGIRVALWDCDACSYKIEKDSDIEITEAKSELAWCDGIKLTLDIKTLT